ncbi:MAG: peptide chain release factor N(5)-glutamine methyltransferase [Candidatus Peregrinibacteria bacterium]
MKIKEILKWGHETLILSSSSARLDAELLLAHVLRRPVTFLLAHDETELGLIALWRYKRFIGKRKQGMPVAYLVGHKEFYFLDFEVNRHVLVPRPDTETLVWAAIEYVKNARSLDSASASLGMTTRFLLLDVGTGSGCIAISVLKNVPELTAIATDISRNALRVAKRNARKHGVAERIEFIHSDLLDNVPIERLKKYDVILTANLPYVPKNFSVNPETKFEPDSSLYGGHDGTEVYKRLMEQLKTLQPRAIFIECFDFQKAILATHFSGYELKHTEPLTGQARMLYLERA